MANEIKYQINGQLADNTVTVDNKEDMILVPVSIGSADENRIIAELKAEDSGLREETIPPRLRPAKAGHQTHADDRHECEHGIVLRLSRFPRRHRKLHLESGKELHRGELQRRRPTCGKPSRQPQWASSARKEAPCTSAACRMPPPVHRMLQPRQDAPSPLQARKLKVVEPTRQWVSP